MVDVQGFCPMGCGATLFLGNGGYITCRYIHCPCPDAVSTLLDDRETDHVVHLHERTFTVRHPLRERLDDALMRCGLDQHLIELDGPPRSLGRYRVGREGERWTWQRIESEET